MTDPLVVARFKGDGPLRFTASTTIEKLTAQLIANIPVDKIFFVTPTADGSGYSLREAGLVALDILSPGDQPQATPLEPPLTQHTPATIELDRMIRDVENGLTEAAAQAHLERLIPDDDLPSFPRPKSQSDLLAERGLPHEPKATPSKRKRTTKSKLLVDSPQEWNDTLRDDHLPTPPSTGKRQVTSISTATNAEASAASQMRSR